MQLPNYFQTIHWTLYEPFTRATESGRSMGGFNFGNILPINVPKCCGGKVCFLTRNFQSHNSMITNLVFTLPLRILLRSWTLSFKKDTITAKTASQLNCQRRQKVEIYLANEGSDLAFFSTDLRHIFGSNVGNEFGVVLRQRTSQTIIYLRLCPHTLTHDIEYTDVIEYNIVGDTKAPLLRCFPFVSKLKTGDIITTGQYMNYQTFRNLQFRPRLNISFHSIHIDLRDTRGEKIPFVSVGITRLVLMFREASYSHV